MLHPKRDHLYVDTPPIHGGEIAETLESDPTTCSKKWGRFGEQFVKARKETRASVKIPVERLLQICCCWLVQHVKHGKTESSMQSSSKDWGMLYFLF